MNPSSQFNLFNNEINTISSGPLDNKNISSCNDTKTKSKDNFTDDLFIHITHPYIKGELSLPTIEPYRTQHVQYRQDIKIVADKTYLPEAQRRWAYTGSEENIYCGRFPHLDYCGCKYPCSLMLEKITPIEIFDNIYCGPIETVYKYKELLDIKIGYVLNVSCIEYNKRPGIKYFDIYINDNHTENAIKFFKITNRFIHEAITSRNNILIHSEHGRSRCWVFLMAYLIGRRGYKFSEAYEKIKEKFPRAEPNDNYLTQLKHYDLSVNV